MIDILNPTMEDFARASFAAIPAPVILDEVIAHLGAALIQSIPSDDQRIISHVRSAHELAKILKKGMAR